MGFARAQVAIPRDTTVPEDVTINVWHFITSGTVTADAGAIVNRLNTFYNAIDGEISSITASPAVIKVYDLEAAPPRVPVSTQNMTVTPGAGTPAPEELAICLSFEALPESGQIQARRRGRLYLGPIQTGAFSPVSGRVLVTAGVRTTIANAAAAMAGAGTEPTARWAVFSPTTAGPEPWSGGALSSAFQQVDRGWVDDAIDIQRRRGPAAQNRTNWVAT